MIMTLLGNSTQTSRLCCVCHIMRNKKPRPITTMLVTVLFILISYDRFARFDNEQDAQACLTARRLQIGSVTINFAPSKTRPT